MIVLVFSTIYFLLPAYLANMTPVIAARLNVLPRLDHPIDGGRKFRGDYICGRTKTWRGFIVGVATAMFVGAIQFFLWQFNVVRLNSAVDFSMVDPLMFGFFGGVGALGGDLIKSMVKRRFKIKSGDPWPIFDQLDFILGYFLAVYFIVPVTLELFITAIIITLIVHPLTNMLAYVLKIKNVWW